MKDINIERVITMLSVHEEGEPSIGDITPYDRILSIRFGVQACEMIDQGLFGNMATLKGESMSYVSLEEVIGAAKIGKQKHVDPNGELVRAAKAMGICFGDE